MKNFRMAVLTSLIGLATGVAFAQAGGGKSPAAKRLHSLGEKLVAS